VQRAADVSTRSQELRVDDIRPNPYQPRQVFNEIALQELAGSILEHGVLQPVIVRRSEEGYQLVSGERRLQAARRAGLTTIPAIIAAFDDRKTLEVAIVENIQREDIGPLEAAEAYRRLIDEFGLTQEQVALRVGKSRPAVANTLRLLKLPADIRDSLARGHITEGHARSLLAIDDADWRRKVWMRILTENLSVRDAEAMSRQRHQDPDSPDASPLVSRATRETDRRQQLDPDLADVEKRLRHALGTRVRVSGSTMGGQVRIDFYSEEDLNRILNIVEGA
jgi:ParB family transcriptional regulator, chromosome partitioning protein